MPQKVTLQVAVDKQAAEKDIRSWGDLTKKTFGSVLAEAKSLDTTLGRLTLNSSGIGKGTQEALGHLQDLNAGIKETRELLGGLGRVRITPIRTGLGARLTEDAQQAGVRVTAITQRQFEQQKRLDDSLAASRYRNLQMSGAQYREYLTRRLAAENNSVQQSIRLNNELADLQIDAMRKVTAALREEDRKRTQESRQAAQQQARDAKEAAASAGGNRLMQRGANISSIGSGMRSAGQAMTWGYSAPVVAGVGYALKSAVSREDSTADVAKVFPKESAERIAQVRKELTDLTHELPLSYKELAALANEGGQMGVPIDGLKEYVRVAAQLGLVTDMSASEATTGLAKIAAAMGLNVSNGPEAGKTFHDLAEQLAQMGIEGSASGSEIVDLAQRLASAGKNVGMTSGDVFALANGLTSLGQNAEAGGTAAVRTLGLLSRAVATGGKQLREFANVSGVSTADFKKRFQTDALGALLMFTEGLSRLHGQGVDVSKTLFDMGIKGANQTIMLQNLSHAYGQVAGYRKDVSRAVQEGGVIEAAAAKKTEAAASQIKIMENRSEELAAKLGTDLLPSLLKLAPEVTKLFGVISHLIDRFEALPRPVKDAALELLAVSVVAGPVISGLGGIFTIVGSVARGVAALKALKTASELKDIVAGMADVEGGAKGAGDSVGGLATKTGGLKGLLLSPLGEGTLGALLLKGGLVTLGVGLDVYFLKKDFDLAADTKKLTAGAAKQDAGIGRDGGFERNTVGTITRINQTIDDIREGIKRDKARLAGMPAENRPYSWLTGPVENSPRYHSLQARIRKEYADMGALRASARQHEGALDRLHGRQPGTEDAGGVGVAPTSGVGERIADAAWKRQIGLDRKAYDRKCQVLARETVSAITPAFDKIWDRSKGASALSNLHRFQAAGLAKRYSAGMAVPAGTLLYSTTMGEGAGHVQVVGDGGRRFDQHGTNRFKLSNFQWYVPPPMGGGSKAAPRVPYDPSLFENPADKKARDKAADAQSDLSKRLYEARHNEYQNQRYEAYQTFKDYRGTDPAKAKALLLATLKKIDQDEEKEQKDHQKRTEAEQKASLARLQARQREYWDGVIAGRKKVEAAKAAATEARAQIGDHLASLADPDAAGFDQERGAAQKRFRDRVRSFGGDPSLSNAQLQRMPYSPQTLKDFQSAQDELQGSLDDIGRRQGQKATDTAQKVTGQAAQDAAEVADFQKQATQQQADLNREIWQHAGGDMSAYFKSLRDEADAALEEVKAKYGVGSKNPNAAAVSAAQGVHDARYAVIGQQQVDDAKSAQERIDQAQAESVRFEYEQHIISLSQYQIYLRQKLALTQQYETPEDRKNGVLSRNWMQIRGELDASEGETRAKPRRAETVGGQPFWDNLAEGASDAGSRALDSFLHPKDRKDIFKAFWADLAGMGEDALKGGLKAILKNALTTGGGGILGGLFGGRRSGGGTAAGSVTSAIGMIGAAPGGATAVPLSQPASPLGDLGGFGSMLSGGRIPGGLGSDPGMGGMSGMSAGGGSSPLGLMGVLGKGGLGGLFSRGGLFNASGALGGFGAALPWIGGGLMLNSVLGNPLGKLAKGIGKIFHFAQGGRPALGRVSMLGEKGIEGWRSDSGHLSLVGTGGPTLFEPRVPGTIIPNDRLTAMFAPRISVPDFRPGGGQGAGVSPQGQAVAGGGRGGESAAQVTVHQYGDHVYRSEMDIQAVKDAWAKDVQKGRRTGIPAAR